MRWSLRITAQWVTLGAAVVLGAMLLMEVGL